MGEWVRPQILRFPGAPRGRPRRWSRCAAHTALRTLGLCSVFQLTYSFMGVEDRMYLNIIIF